MSRSRLFVENILIYGLGSLLARLVPFVMLPVITRLMPGTSYFGLSDLSNTIVSFAQAFATMGIFDAMFRIFLDKTSDDDKRISICSTALYFVTGSSLIVVLLLLLFEDSLSRLFFGSAEFTVLVVISAINVFSGSTATITQAPTRMQNKRLTFIVMNFISAIASYAVAIFLLMINQYLIALPVSALISSLIMLFVFSILNRRWFAINAFDKQLLKELLLIGVPLMPTFLFYWIFDSADRLMIVNILGTAEAGIYAIALRVGMISQLIYTAFAQGWQYFAFKTMHDEDQVALTSKIYEYMGVISFISTGFLIVILAPFYHLMFPVDYDSGMVCAPYLFLAPLLLMLFHLAENQFIVIKKTWPCIIFQLIGIIANLILNFILIPIVGIEGAAVATLFGYIATLVAQWLVLTKIKLIAIRFRFLTVAILFGGLFFAWRFYLQNQTAKLLLVWFIFFILCIVLYRKELIGIIKRFKVLNF